MTQALLQIYCLVQQWKNFLKSANISKSYERISSGTFSMGHGVEYYIKVGIASLLWHSDLPRYPAGKTFLFQIKKYVKYDYGLLFDLASDHSCCQWSSTVVVWQVWSSVVNRMQPSESVVNSYRQLRWQHVWYDAVFEQELGQLLFTLTVFLFYFITCFVLYAISALNFGLVAGRAAGFWWWGGHLASSDIWHSICLGVLYLWQTRLAGGM